ncbi:unnamed protein product [Albugo candida]|uniref:Uncharacterized protein n=1 Tax=Albugo candida TaxID=65357 RepID=A0A024GVK9_9STRA|nr:unnamed protein product [Albugo candida]|eukprot:CCI50837.1 unnamed protein product [Albugo candida]
MTIPAGTETINVSFSQIVFETKVPRYGRPRIHYLQPTISESPGVLPHRVSSAHLSAPPMTSLAHGIERRNTRIVNELKEAQKKGEVLSLTPEGLDMREAAEWKNAFRYRAVSIRMLTRLELGHCIWLPIKYPLHL